MTGAFRAPVIFSPKRDLTPQAHRLYNIGVSSVCIHNYIFYTRR